MTRGRGDIFTPEAVHFLARSLDGLAGALLEEETMARCPALTKRGYPCPNGTLAGED